MAEVWCNKGATLGQLRRTKEELECYNEALRINPQLAEAWYNKGMTLYHLRRYRDARLSLGKAAALGDPDARRVLGSMTKDGH